MCGLVRKLEGVGHHGAKSESLFQNLVSYFNLSSRIKCLMRPCFRLILGVMWRSAKEDLKDEPKRVQTYFKKFSKHILQTTLKKIEPLKLQYVTCIKKKSFSTFVEIVAM